MPSELSIKRVHLSFNLKERWAQPHFDLFALKRCKEKVAYEKETLGSTYYILEIGPSPGRAVGKDRKGII